MWNYIKDISVSLSLPISLFIACHEVCFKFQQGCWVSPRYRPANACGDDFLQSHRFRVAAYGGKGRYDGGPLEYILNHYISRSMKQILSGPSRHFVAKDLWETVSLVLKFVTVSFQSLRARVLKPEQRWRTQHTSCDPSVVICVVCIGFAVLATDAASHAFYFTRTTAW